jgi:hypothetical protein
MELTLEQKRTLVTRFMPVLLVSEDDMGPPIDPSTFVSEAALWGGQRPQLDNKLFWGQSAGAGRRRPNIARGSLDVSVLPMGQSLDEDGGPTEFWLDCAGWLSGPDVEPGADNREVNLPRLKAMFGAATEPVVRAEACAADTWLALAGTTAAPRSLGLPGTELVDFLSTTVLINVHCLFAARSDDSQEIAGNGTVYRSASYEGDWVCFSIILRSPNPDADVNELRPVYALCERRFRNQSASFGENLSARGFDAVPWSAMSKIGERPVVLVSTGTHNLYPADVETTPTGGLKTQSGSFGFADNLTDDINKWVKKTVVKNWPASAAVFGVTLAKMAAGAAIAGPFGALAGLVAGIAEAGPIGKALGKDPGSPDIDPTTTSPPDGKLKDPGDKFKSGSGVGQKFVAISPQATTPAQLQAFLTFDGTVQRVVNWAGASFEPINRIAERFWPTHDGLYSLGYVGRWGVRCENDGNNRRAGDILPDYRVEVLRSSLALLA